MTDPGDVRAPMMTGDELGMALGRAHAQTADPVVWVDGRCIGCGAVSVNTVPAREEWGRGGTFADYCGACNVICPHTVQNTLKGVNEQADRGRVQRGGGR